MIKSNEQNKIAYASFCIYSSSINIEFWNNYFGLCPDLAYRKDEARLMRNGKIARVPSRIGAWLYSAKSHVDSDQLDPYIMFLITKFGLPRSDLPDLLARMNTNMRCFCFWDNYSGDRVAQVSPHLQDMLAKSGIALEIDEYPGTNNGHPWPDVADEVIP